MGDCIGDYIYIDDSRAVVEPSQSRNKGVSLTPFRCTHDWQLVLENPSIRELIKAILMQVVAG